MTLWILVLRSKKRLLVLALVLMALTPLSLGSAIQLPKGWTHGWSQPLVLGVGDRLLGYQSVAMSSGAVVVAYGHSEGTVSRLVIGTYDVTGGSVTDTSSIEVEGLREYALTATGDSVYLATLSRKSDAVTEPWQFEAWSLIEGGRANVRLVTAFNRPGIASDITVRALSSDKLVWAWSGSSSGLRNINLLVHDTVGNSVTELVLSHPETSDRYPSLTAEASGNIYLTYYRDNAMFSEVVYRGVTISGEMSPEVVSLGRASPDNPRPLLTTSGAGAAMIYWAQPFRVPGRGQAAAIYAGSITHGGLWHKGLEPVIEIDGTVAQLTVDGADPVNLGWLTDRSGSMQIEYAQLSEVGEVIATGPVTRGSENRFLPRLHVTDSGRALVYAEYTQDSLIIYGVDDVRPAKAPLSYWLGLDPRSPFGDAAFRYVTLFGSAVGLAALAGMSLLFAVLAVLALSRFIEGEDPLSQIPAATILLVLLLLLRRMGGLLYYGSVQVPGTAGLVLVAGSAVFALGSSRFMRRHVHGILSLFICGFLFMAAHFFSSIYVGGLLP